jgi:pimeloyl-ACP methyl ester carboxylesterase
MPLELHRGLTFHVQEIGDVARAPAVMLHGLLLGSMATFYFTIAPALAETRRVLMYDLRGHGKSERAKSGYDIPNMAGDLAAMTERFGDEPVTLVGHSYGAAIALHYALKNPTRVRELVLIDAPLPASRLDELGTFMQRTPEEMVEALPGPLKDALARKGRQATRFVDGLRFLATESSLMSDLQRAEDIPDEALRALGCPVLCVYGKNSSCLPVGQRLARVIPNARLVVLDGGHFLPVDAPRALADTIKGFIDG